MYRDDRLDQGFQCVAACGPPNRTIRPSVPPYTVMELSLARINLLCFDNEGK